MSVWLSPEAAAAMVEVSATAAASSAWAADVDAACAWVERKRRDLFTTDDPAVFVADGAIKLGTAMFANRLYARRKSPLGTSQNVEFGGSDFLRQDPDISKLLGLGAEGKFRFGAPTTPAPPEGTP